MKRILSILAFALALSIPAAHAQGCAMCSQGARAASADSQRALRRAVTVLLIPPVLMMAGFVGFAVRYRNRREQGESIVPPADQKL
jgi:hypothetical protein